MPAAQVAGLPETELKTALAYEVEPFSGVPAGEAEIKYEIVSNDDPTLRVYSVSVERRAHGSSARMKAVYLKAAYVFAAVVIAVTAVDALLTRSGLDKWTAETAKRERLDAAVKGVEREAAAKRTEAEAIRKAREAAVAAQESVAAKRRAYAEVLGVIAAEFDGRAVVTEITADEDGFAFRAKATAVTVAAAADTLKDLTAAAEKKGWRVESGTIKDDGALVRFEFEGTDRNVRSPRFGRKNEL